MLCGKRCVVEILEITIANQSSSMMLSLTKSDSRRMLLREMKHVGGST